jgi:uncharacterized tellurite resistance protein B-like protein
MIGSIRKFFAKDAAAARGDVNKLESQGIQVAVCAILSEFSETERENIIGLLKERYGLSDEYAAELMKASSSQLEGSIDLWQFTNLINANYSREDKVQIIEMVWQIVYADGKLDKHEDYLVHKLAKLLRLTHKQLIDAKLKVCQSPPPKPQGRQD